MTKRIGKLMCELVFWFSFAAAILTVSAISNGDLTVTDGAWKLVAMLVVIIAAAWKRGWMK